METPVGMPVFRKQRRFLVRLAAHGGDMLAPGDGREKRVLAKGTKGLGKPFQIIVADLLIGKGKDMMFEPSGADCGDGFRRK